MINNRKFMEQFPEWFADCVIFCVEKGKGPDDYVWDLQNCPEWMEYYSLGMSVDNAVNAHFTIN